ncbi:MAG: hypothetical protein IPN76_19060 [Saprospiraceae bacterium]|nr:hypothetical protein [Saprospiraceae bacterium]
MKQSLIPLLFAALFFAACGEKPAPTPEAPAATEPDLSIIIGEKIGLITPANCTQEGILAAYGKDAKVDSIYLIDGMYGEGVVLFPDNPRRKVSVFWDNHNDPGRPAFIRIDGDSTGITDWKTAEGITLGTPLAELEKLNGNAFEISGFGWDYGGYVTDWKGGKFNISLGIRMAPTADEASAKVSGEGGFNSQNPDMQAAKPVVTRMEFRFLANEKLPDCIAALVAADKEQGRMNVLKLNLNGSDHYWLQSGAAAYDGIEYVYQVIKDGKCEEVCQMGGMRMPPPCQKVYEGKQWELVWEEK